MIIESDQLLSWRRFDLGVKLAYLKLRNKNPKFAKKIYASHIHAFSLGTFTEPGNPEKCSIEIYLKDFETISDSIARDGFLENLGTVPLSSNRVILNGSHRTASAIFHGKQVIASIIADASPVYDWNYFKRRGLCSDYLDFTAITLVKQMKNARIALLWPRSRRYHDSIVAKIGRVIYEKDVKLTTKGLHHLLCIIYKNDDWLGIKESGYQGAYGKLRKIRSWTTSIVRVLAFEEESPGRTIAMKSLIRLTLPFDKHSIHISDTHEETVDISNALFNQNSIDFLNTSNPYHIKGIFDKISELKGYILENEVDADDIVVDGSFVMERYGLRRSKDIDLLSLQYLRPSENTRTPISVRRPQEYFHSREIRDMIYDPRNYFISEGLKFSSIQQVAISKAKRLEIKDVRDLAICLTVICIHPWGYIRSNLLPALRLIRAIANSKLPRLIRRKEQIEE